MVLWKKLIIVVVVFIAIILLFNSLIMPFYVKQNKLVKVPSVVGMNFNDAKKVLDDADLEGIQGDIRYDANKSIGTVLDQNPSTDQIVKSGRRIYLIVSGGEQLYDVPNLVGRSVRESKFALAQRNLELQELETKQSAQYPSGTILSQVEPAGSKVKQGTKIGVVISQGIETGNLKVPDLIGKGIEEAKKLIAQSHMILGKINYQPSTSGSINSVMDQFPKGNTMANENQRIDIFVNKEIQQKVTPKEEEMNSIEEVKPEKEKLKTEEKKETDKEKKETDKEKKTDVKKDLKEDIKKDDKSKDQDKKSDTKKTDKSKDTDKKENDGTKF